MRSSTGEDSAVSRSDAGAMTETTYRITVRGRLSERRVLAFDGMTLEPNGGDAVPTGTITDQSHLFGILEALRDLGLELTAVERVEP